jgi:coiled-coil domain-containing protein 78
MAEMKNKFNQQVAAKSDLQEQLINSEEEKLNVSKALIDLQIENTKLNEQMLNSNHKINTDLLHTQEEL